MRISAEGAETLSQDLLESVLEEWFKTVRRILSSVLGHCDAGLFYSAKLYTLCLKKRPLLYFE